MGCLLVDLRILARLQSAKIVAHVSRLTDVSAGSVVTIPANSLNENLLHRGRAQSDHSQLG